MVKCPGCLEEQPLLFKLKRNLCGSTLEGNKCEVYLQVDKAIS